MERLAVERASDGAFIGWCALTRWNPDYRSASLGYCFDDAAWGHGYATEAALALLQWAFDTLDLNRVQAETDTRNAASARVLEKQAAVSFWMRCDHFWRAAEAGSAWSRSRNRRPDELRACKEIASPGMIRVKRSSGRETEPADGAKRTGRAGGAGEVRVHRAARR